MNIINDPCPKYISLGDSSEAFGLLGLSFLILLIRKRYVPVSMRDLNNLLKNKIFNFDGFLIRYGF
ncbi:hypothetical protein D3C81_2199340 [compost metagenome]